MRTETLVRASADVVTIVTLKPGDVYKRLVKASNSFESENAYKATFGVVESIDSNGQDTMVSVIEFSKDYSGVAAKSVVFGTEREIKVFAATPPEIAVKFDEFRRELDKKVTQAERAHGDAIAQRVLLSEIMDKTTAGELSTPEFVLHAPGYRTDVINGLGREETADDESF
jgi:hypothetical protein